MTANPKTGSPAQENRKNIQLYQQALAQAEEARKKRDIENRLVAEAKKKRDEVFSKLKPLEKELGEKMRELAGLDSKHGSRNIEKEIERLEWEQQTEATSPRKEKDISKKIKALRQELKGAKKNDSLHQAVYDLKKKARELESEVRAVHQALVTHAKESDLFHEKMLELRRQAEGLRKSISENLAKIMPNNGGHQKRQNNGFAPRKFEEKTSYMQGKADRMLEEFKKGKKLSTEDLKLFRSLPPSR